MFSSVIVFALLGSVSAIVDLNCTSGGAYTQIATACQNTYSPSTCNLIYPATSGTVTPGGTMERPANCFNGTNGFSEDVKDLAVSSCASTCGYCCDTTAYNCANAVYPRINCATVTNAMCQDPSWRQIIATDCPNSCGFCNLGGCIDVAPDCATQPTVCVTIGLESFVAANCQRTCGLCSTTTISSSSVLCTASLVDSSSECSAWAANGFCSSTFYTTAQKKSYCAKTCGLC